jgi:hypothetical protein
VKGMVSAVAAVATIVDTKLDAANRDRHRLHDDPGSVIGARARRPGGPSPVASGASSEHDARMRCTSTGDGTSQHRRRFSHSEFDLGR